MTRDLIGRLLLGLLEGAVERCRGRLVLVYDGHPTYALRIFACLPDLWLIPFTFDVKDYEQLREFQGHYNLAGFLP